MRALPVCGFPARLLAATVVHVTEAILEQLCRGIFLHDTVDSSFLQSRAQGTAIERVCRVRVLPKLGDIVPDMAERILAEFQRPDSTGGLETGGQLLYSMHVYVIRLRPH